MTKIAMTARVNTLALHEAAFTLEWIAAGKTGTDLDNDRERAAEIASEFREALAAATELANRVEPAANTPALELAPPPMTRRCMYGDSLLEQADVYAMPACGDQIEFGGVRYSIERVLWRSATVADLQLLTAPGWHEGERLQS